MQPITLNYKEISDMIQNVFRTPKMFCAGFTDQELIYSFEALIYGLNLCRGTSTKLLKLESKEVSRRKGGCWALCSVISSFDEYLQFHKQTEEEILKED